MNDANDIARSILRVGDVIQFPSPDPMVQLEQLPYYGPITPLNPLNFNRAFGPGYDYEWHRILTPAPANDAMLDAIRNRIG
jgi:hypothetical protein